MIESREVKRLGHSVASSLFFFSAAVPLHRALRERTDEKRKAGTRREHEGTRARRPASLSVRLAPPPLGDASLRDIMGRRRDAESRSPLACSMGNTASLRLQLSFTWFLAVKGGCFRERMGRRSGAERVRRWE